MSKITRDIPLTDTPYVRMYQLEGINKAGKSHNYYRASRTMRPEELKLYTRRDTADGVVIYALDDQGRMVLVRQYRCTIDDYIYELPAGLVEPGEDYRQAAIREMKEDFLKTQSVSKEITLDWCRAVPLHTRLLRSVLRVFAPLM